MDESTTLLTLLIIPPDGYENLIARNVTIGEVRDLFVSYCESKDADFPWTDTQAFIFSEEARWPISQVPLCYAKSPKTDKLYPLFSKSPEPVFNDGGFLASVDEPSAPAQDADLYGDSPVATEDDGLASSPSDTAFAAQPEDQGWRDTPEPGVTSDISEQVPLSGSAVLSETDVEQIDDMFSGEPG